VAQNAPTTTAGFNGFLPPEISAPIFEEAAKQSVVQQLSRQVPLGANGKDIPVVTGKPQAGWVAEGTRKPTTNGTVALKTMRPFKLAAISVMSAEVVRADPVGYATNLRTSLAEAFAVAFDLAALYDQGPDGTPGGGPFPTYLAQTTHTVELGASPAAEGGIYADLNQSLRDLLGRRKRLTGFALDATVEADLNDAVDLNGRPIFVDSPLTETAGPVRAGRLIGRPAFLGELEAAAGAAGSQQIVGFAGDWSKTAYGVVGGISYDVSDQATVTLNGQLVSLFENNLVAVRAEAEYGFLVADPDSFVELTREVA
jgi:HK97 family phage major capsid protein